jgi:hypothetical protein
MKKNLLKRLNRSFAIIFGLFLVLSFAAFETQAVGVEKNEKRENAAEIIKKAMAAMGGEDKLRALRSLYFEGIGHNNSVEQSERPEGPYIVAYEQIKETRDLIGSRFLRSQENRMGQMPEWTVFNYVGTKDFLAMEMNGRFFPGQKSQMHEELFQMALAPEKILLTALEASDLRLEKDTVMQDVPHRVLRFTHRNVPVTLYLNANTFLPTMVETKSFSAYSHFWQVWGDVTTRTFYSYWTLESGGLRYPHQLDIFKNEYHVRSFTITKLKFNIEIPEDSFKVSEDVRTAYAKQPLMAIDDLPLGRPDQPAHEIAPGIVNIPGRWNVAIVRQTDGIVIIEAPISSGYSAKVIEEAGRRFPGVPIKAVITTSDAFPHLGGVREYVARNVPVYALDLNLPILRRLIAAPHSISPDMLERNKRKPDFKVVMKKTVIGEGANRLEIYPIRSETGERMMMIYFPEHKLLYGSDLIQQMRDGSFFMTQYLAELMQAVERENLSVSDVFAMHNLKIPYAEIVKAVRRDMEGNLK